MRRSFKFPLRPTSKQAVALTEMLADHCSLYNGALEERRTAYRQCGVTVTYPMQSAQLKDVRGFDSQGQARWSFSSQQATLRRLDKAMRAFFRRVHAGQAPGYPRFRGVGWFDTVEFPKDGDGVRWDSVPHDAVIRVRFQGVFLGSLAHKADSAGRTLIPVDPRNTSPTCPRCRPVSGDNRRAQAEFVCVACGHTANADVVGAFNIAHRAGLVLREALTA